MQPVAQTGTILRRHHSIETLRGVSYSRAWDTRREYSRVWRRTSYPTLSFPGDQRADKKQDHLKAKHEDL